MSLKEIMESIMLFFEINENSFELEVYDQRYQRFIDFDDEYVEELRHILPITHKKQLHVRVLLQNVTEMENVARFNYDDFVSLSMSVSEEHRPATPSIDFNICSGDNRPLSISAQLEHVNQDYWSHHVMFVRDVILYQQLQQQFVDFCTVTSNLDIIHDSYVMPIHGIKKIRDGKYVGVLPEIKLPSTVSQLDHIKLLVAIVSESFVDEKVIWYLDTQSGFFDGNINPTGHVAKKLHSSDHVPNTVRLACVVVGQYDIILWDTFGLSDFMPVYKASNFFHKSQECRTKRKAEVLDTVIRDCFEPNEKPLKMLYLFKPTTVLNAYTIQQKSCEVYEHSLNWLKRYKSMIEIQTLNNDDVMFHKCDLLIDFPFMEYKCQFKGRAAILLQSNAILYSFNGIVSIFTELCKTMMHTVQCKDRFKQDLVDPCDRSFNNEEEYPCMLLRFQFDYIHAESLCWCTREGFTYPSLNKILKANIGNLISMNEFLSISTNRKVAYLFAKSASCSLDSLRVIFA
ncbi:hypothetical protein I4U23_012263 [Adineta vaga]|nr:hypothetical protein I4U23_012263 [Adineta vaga]